MNGAEEGKTNLLTTTWNAAAFYPAYQSQVRTCHSFLGQTLACTWPPNAGGCVPMLPMGHANPRIQNLRSSGGPDLGRSMGCTREVPRTLDRRLPIMRAVGVHRICEGYIKCRRQTSPIPDHAFDSLLKHLQVLVLGSRQLVTHSWRPVVRWRATLSSLPPSATVKPSKTQMSTPKPTSRMLRMAMPVIDPSRSSRR